MNKYRVLILVMAICLGCNSVVYSEVTQNKANIEPFLKPLSQDLFNNNSNSVVKLRDALVEEQVYVANETSKICSADSITKANKSAEKVPFIATNLANAALKSDIDGMRKYTIDLYEQNAIVKSIDMINDKIKGRCAIVYYEYRGELKNIKKCQY